MNFSLNLTLNNKVLKVQTLDPMDLCICIMYKIESYMQLTGNRYYVNKCMSYCDNTVNVNGMSPRTKMCISFFFKKADFILGITALGKHTSCDFQFHFSPVEITLTQQTCHLAKAFLPINLLKLSYL